MSDNDKKPPLPICEFKDDEPTLPESQDTGLAPDGYNLTFVKAGVNVGCLWWDEQERRLKFTGEVDESADLFFQFVQMNFLQWELTRGN